MRERLQSRLRRRACALTKFHEPLAPPGQADRPQLRHAARRHHIGKREIELPESEKRGTDSCRGRLERDFPVGVERPFSDR